MSFQLTERQEQIVEIVKNEMPISGANIASKLGLKRTTLRSDFSILTMTNILVAKPKVGYYYNKNHAAPFFLSSFKQKYVKEVMAAPIILKEDSPIQEAINLLFLEDTGSIYISDGVELAGIVSRKDLLKATLSGQNNQNLPISIVMSRMPNILTVDINDTIENAVKKLVLHKVDSLPVVEVRDEQVLIVGKFSKTVTTSLLLEILENNLPKKGDNE